MIEDIILRHSQRGMDVLRPYMPKAFCEEAVEALLNLPHGVIFLTTGFYVAGYAETDGPLGTEVLAQALKKLGYQPVIVTDALCKDYFEPMGLEVEYVPFLSGPALKAGSGRSDLYRALWYQQQERLCKYAWSQHS